MSKGDLVIRQTKKMATLKKDLIKTAKENNRDLSDYARLALKHAIENKLKF